MNFSIFLILLHVVPLVFGAVGNSTEDVSCNVCTLSLFRRKRANMEYTRWRANPETKQEFIVKVLDDDIPTSEAKQIAAVNIAPVTKAQEKIIIKGAVPITKQSTYNNMLKEYTRFVPPTTLAVTRIDGNIIVAPVKPVVDEIPPLRPYDISKLNDAIFHEMLSLRPHGTKHGTEVKLSHDWNLEHVNTTMLKSQTLMSRQYAPIAPVSFTRRNAIGPLTPRTVDNFMLRKTTVRPTRTSANFDVVAPPRTSTLVNFFPFNKPSTRTTLTSIDIERTSLTDDARFSEKQYRKFQLDNIPQSNKDTEKELDKSYNDLSYDYETTTKRQKQSFRDNYDDIKIRDDDNTLDTGSNKSSDDTVDLEKSKQVTSTQQSYINYEDEDYVSNPKGNCTSESNSTTVITTQVNDTSESSNLERNLICSVLKLRPLSFSSPLTLHEIVTQLKVWAGESPVAKWLDITNGNYTVMENPIYMMIVDDLSSGQIVSAKKTVMIVAGIQGRDHHAVTAAMYVLYQLIERTDAHSDLLNKFRFWIIPVFNPDGYDYSMTFPRLQLVFIQWLVDSQLKQRTCSHKSSYADEASTSGTASN